MAWLHPDLLIPFSTPRSLTSASLRLLAAPHSRLKIRGDCAFVVSSQLDLPRMGSREGLPSWTPVCSLQTLRCSSKGQSSYFIVVIIIVVIEIIEITEKEFLYLWILYVCSSAVSNDQTYIGHKGETNNHFKNTWHIIGDSDGHLHSLLSGSKCSLRKNRWS